MTQSSQSTTLPFTTMAGIGDLLSKHALGILYTIIVILLGVNRELVVDVLQCL